MVALYNKVPFVNMNKKLTMKKHLLILVNAESNIYYINKMKSCIY